MKADYIRDLAKEEIEQKLVDAEEELLINAPGNGSGKVYVSSVKLNGRSLDVNYVTHRQLTAGGTLEFYMSPVPEMKRGIKPSSRPYSMSTATAAQPGS